MENENHRLKLLVAELSLHGEALMAVIRKRVELADLGEEVAFVSAETSVELSGFFGRKQPIAASFVDKFTHGREPPG